MSIHHRIKWFLRHQVWSWQRLFSPSRPFDGGGMICTDIPDAPGSHNRHPSESCNCESRFVMSQSSSADPSSGISQITGHYADCEWARVMCLQCHGNGYCRECGGDGTDPTKIASPTPHEHRGCPDECRVCLAEHTYADSLCAKCGISLAASDHRACAS